MQKLNLPQYPFKIIKVTGEKKQIFDPVRKKYVALLPEEWVRQHFAQFLISVKKFPQSLLAFEYPLKYNTLQKRGDIVVFGKDGQPKLIVECKAPEIQITQKVFDQVARYNMTLKLNYLVLTNGIQHYCCYIDHVNESFTYLEDVPDYDEL